MKTTKCYPQVGDFYDTPPPPYNPLYSKFKLVATQDDYEANSSYLAQETKQQDDAANDNLTSTFEEDDAGVFGGISLFYFLINSAFSSLLPFLSILLYHNGFSASQIGVAYTAVFLISILSSTIWNTLITESGQNKHAFMLISIGSWIVGYVPLIWIKRHPVVDECVFLPPNKTLQASQNLSHVYNFGVDRHVNHTTNFYQTFESWTGLVDYKFLFLLGVLCLGRIFQSSTDYFYFDHKRLMYPATIATKLSSNTSYHVSTKVSAAIITIFIGHMLDSILYCNPSLGHFQILFYLFLVFAASSLFVLYFLDLSYFQRSDQYLYNNDGDKEASSQKRPPNSMFLKLLLVFGQIVSGATRAFHYTFLQLKLASVNALYVQIGAAFAIHTIVRTMVKLFAQNYKQVALKLGITETFIIITSVDSIRNLFFSYITSSDENLLWFVLPMELLSGFSSLLNNNSQTDTQYIDKGKTVSERCFFVCYWCIGYTFGPLVFGFGQDMWSIDYVFIIVAVVNICFAVLFAVASLICTASRSVDETRGKSNRTLDNHTQMNAFLITKNQDNQ